MKRIAMPMSTQVLLGLILLAAGVGEQAHAQLVAGGGGSSRLFNSYNSDPSAGAGCEIAATLQLYSSTGMGGAELDLSSSGNLADQNFDNTAQSLRIPQAADGSLGSTWAICMSRDYQSCWTLAESDFSCDGSFCSIDDLSSFLTGAANDEISSAAMLSCPGVTGSSKSIFVTSSSMNGNIFTQAEHLYSNCAGSADSQSAADCVCQTAASNANLTGNFLAWLGGFGDSTPFEDNTQYVTVTDTLLLEAGNYSGDVSVQNPFNVDENGSTVSASTARFWANPGQQDTITISPGGSCTDYTVTTDCNAWTKTDPLSCSSSPCESNCGSGAGYTVQSNLTDAFLLSDMPDGGSAAACSSGHRLLCVQQ